MQWLCQVSYGLRVRETKCRKYTTYEVFRLSLQEVPLLRICWVSWSRRQKCQIVRDAGSTSTRDVERGPIGAPDHPGLTVPVGGSWRVLTGCRWGLACPHRLSVGPGLSSPAVGESWAAEGREGATKAPVQMAVVKTTEASHCPCWRWSPSMNECRHADRPMGHGGGESTDICGIGRCILFLRVP